jgi:predicted tellurium resistance membrane protein TerC
VVTIVGQEISWRDIILIVGGLFLIGKATFEIHERLEGEEHAPAVGATAVTFGSVIVQIMLLDIIFSLDSVITAVGMADELVVMVAAVVIAVGVMLFSARTIGEFVERHPTLKMLALAFLLLIGTALIAEGLEVHVPKGYIYFAMAFSVFVELLNLRSRRRSPPVHLRDPYLHEQPEKTPAG